jgi:hypothetical protein
MERTLMYDIRLESNRVLVVTLPNRERERLCGLVATFLGYRSGGPGSIPGTTRIKKISGSGTGSTQPREYN